MKLVLQWCKTNTSNIVGKANQDEHGELIVGVSKQRALKILTRADLLE